MLKFYLLFSKGIRFIKLLYAKFLFLNVYKVKFGSNPYVGLNIRANEFGAIAIGDNCVLSDGVRMWCELPTGYLKAGSNFQLNRDVIVDFTGGVTFGDNVLLSEGVVVYTHSHGYDPHSDPVGNELLIEDNVWIGHNAIILQGVTRIGKNAIVGAGAIVSDNIDDDTVYVCHKGRSFRRKDK